MESTSFHAVSLSLGAHSGAHGKDGTVLKFFPLNTRIGSALVAAAATFAAICATPAMAEELDQSAIEQADSAPSASFTSPLGQGDAQFHQLFSGWEKLDGAAGSVAEAVVRVAVPSRMPLEGARLTSNFGLRMHPVIGGLRQHKGVDLASPIGTPVYATADGFVGKAEWFSSYGNYVQIEHGGALETRYGHLSRIATVQGARVHKGDLIGFVGSTGRSTGPHLHYEVRVAGEAVNPIPYMVETTAQHAFALARGEGGRRGAE